MIDKLCAFTIHVSGRGELSFAPILIPILMHSIQINSAHLRRGSCLNLPGCTSSPCAHSISKMKYRYDIAFGMLAVVVEALSSASSSVSSSSVSVMLMEFGFLNGQRRFFSSVLSLSMLHGWIKQGMFHLWIPPHLSQIWSFGIGSLHLWRLGPVFRANTTFQQSSQY